MPEFQCDQPARGVLAHAALERFEHARTGAPCQMKTRHRIAVAMRLAAAALGPADDWKPAHAHAVQPWPHLAGGEVDKSFGDPARPEILRPVELRRPHPVLQRKLAAVADAHAPLLGAIDEEQAAKRPEGLAAERVLALLLQDDHAFAGIGELGCRDQSGKASADDDRVRVFGHVSSAQSIGQQCPMLAAGRSSGK